MMRNGAERWRVLFCNCNFLDGVGGAGTSPCGGERPPGTPQELQSIAMF